MTFRAKRHVDTFVDKSLVDKTSSWPYRESESYRLGSGCENFYIFVSAFEFSAILNFSYGLTEDRPVLWLFLINPSNWYLAAIWNELSQTSWSCKSYIPSQYCVRWLVDTRPKRFLLMSVRWVRYFVLSFKIYHWNSTQNILSLN